MSIIRYLSGIQPSGALHLGNYFGAIKPQIDLAKQHADSLYFIADLHSLTTVTDRDVLSENIREIAATYMAFGLPDTALLFKQSDILEVGNLSFILSCRLGHGALNRAHAFKEKVAKGLPASTGLFYYPVLMAADILIYGSTHVPVGADQVQHIEITKDVAQAFNAIYGDVFDIPQAVISEFPKIPGVDGQKMSKSYGNQIDLMCHPDLIKSQIKRIITDSRPVEEPKSPDFPLFEILSPFLTDNEREGLTTELAAGKLGYGPLKTILHDKMLDAFAEPRELFKFYTSSDAGRKIVQDRLNLGAEVARNLAHHTLEDVYYAVGLT